MKIRVQSRPGVTRESIFYKLAWSMNNKRLDSLDSIGWDIFFLLLPNLVENGILLLLLGFLFPSRSPQLPKRWSRILDLLVSCLISLLSFFCWLFILLKEPGRRGKRRGGLGSSPIFSNLSGLRLGLEQAGNPFCLLINSSWLLVFISLFYLLLMGLNLYWWKGIHFS